MSNSKIRTNIFDFLKLQQLKYNFNNIFEKTKLQYTMINFIHFTIIFKKKHINYSLMHFVNSLILIIFNIFLTQSCSNFD